MKSLDRKLVRDLWSLKAQVLSIALVIACGIGGFIASFSTHESLLQSRDTYYDTARFPHVFADVKRAPRTLLGQIAAIPGVSEVALRVVRDVQLDVEGVAQPMVARMIGFNPEKPQAMNRATLRSGRWPSPGARGEVVVNQRFAEVRGLRIGSTIHVLLNGRREALSIVGTALTPEYIYPTRGGLLPDDEWFAVLWMDENRLAAAYNMEGAFTSALLRIEHASGPQAVIAALDRVLEPYGTRGAYGRAEQVSNKIVSQEIEQQRITGTVLPSVFLLVAAFILNVVLHRQVNAQRLEIAALKALGYDDAAIAGHYLKFTAVIAALGVGIGILLGIWLGRQMTALYADFFHFPEFHYVLSAWVVGAGSAVAMAAAFGGTLAAIRGVIRLRAAEALRPAAPALFRPLLLERLGGARLLRLLTPGQRMILRNLERQWLRATLAVAGIAGAIAIVIAGTFWRDAVGYFIDVQFHAAQPGDVQLGFVEPVSGSAQYEVARLPGVQEAELARTIGARIRAGHRSYQTVVTGLADGARLQRIVGRGAGGELHEATPIPGALLLTARLARRLGVAPGDTVWVELMDGQRIGSVNARALTVGAVIDELAGMNVWMRMSELNALAGEGPLASSAALRVDAAAEPELLQRLKEMPGVATVIIKRTLLDTFRKTTARNLLFFTAILTAFAATIAAGVVYNNARIQLAERAWELASLRVLGFTRGEVSVLLLGELAIEIAAAVPIGCLFGFGLASLMVSLMHGENFEIPAVILPATYLYAAATAIAAGIISGLLVRHRIDHLDLVAVLKTRE